MPEAEMPQVKSLGADAVIPETISEGTLEDPGVMPGTDLPIPTPDTAEQTMEEPLGESVEKGFREIGEHIVALEKLFEAKILHTAHEEKIVDQMHSELQKYKEDMYSQLVRPILLDIIGMRDSIIRVASAYLDKTKGEQFIPVSTFSTYASDIQDILERNNIEIYKSEKMTDFIPVRQRAIKKAATVDQTLHGKVSESLSDGYNYNGRTISAEKVAVYFYVPEQLQMSEEKEEGV